MWDEDELELLDELDEDDDELDELLDELEPALEVLGGFLTVWNLYSFVNTRCKYRLDNLDWIGSLGSKTRSTFLSGLNG